MPAFNDSKFLGHVCTGTPWASIWKGPQTVFFGHDAKRGLQEHPYAIGVFLCSLCGQFLCLRDCSKNAEGLSFFPNSHLVRRYTKRFNAAIEIPTRILLKEFALLVFVFTNRAGHRMCLWKAIDQLCVAREGFVQSPRSCILRCTELVRLMFPLCIRFFCRAHVVILEIKTLKVGIG